MSIIVASGRAARAGVLFKEARALQLLAQIDTLIIDKTGTLTEGTPRLAGIFTTFSYSQQQLLIMSASLERQSEHPLANAIVKASSGSRLLPVSNFSSSAGRGIAGTVSGKSLVIGTEKYLSGLKIACSHFQAEQPPTKDTLTSVFVAVDEECVGRLDFEDNIRQGAAESLKKLRELGIKTILATGDKETVARQVAGALGIGEVHAAQLPQDKAALVKSLREKGAKVAMAGDGINDAPALAQADVGIAMASATDVAMHSADIVIVKSDIEGIVRAYKISKAMLQNIRQNLVLAFGYNLVAIPLAAGLFAKSMGFGIDPMIAAAAMSLSSVAVIANALRLRRLSL
jgi:Cu+-exporting ATPase